MIGVSNQNVLCLKHATATIEVRIMHGHILQVHQQEQTSLRLTTFSCMKAFARGVAEDIDLSLIRRDHE